MFTHIKNLIDRIKQDSGNFNQHMLVYYQMKNLI